MPQISPQNQGNGMNSAADSKNYQLQLSCVILCYCCYVMSINHLNESDGAMMDSIKADLHRVITTVEALMTELGIGGFMGIEDFTPGMRIQLELTGATSKPVFYHGELVEQQ